MRLTTVAAITLLSVGALSETTLDANVTYSPGCRGSLIHATTVDKIIEHISGATGERCTYATLEVDFKFDTTIQCSATAGGVTAEKIPLDSITGFFKSLHTSKPITIETLRLTLKSPLTRECTSASLSLLQRRSDCSGSRTPVISNVFPSEDKRSLLYRPSASKAVKLDALVSTDLLADSATCVDQSNTVVEAILTLKVTYDLNLPPNANVEVTFDEPECAPKDCNLLSDTATVLACLAAASADPKCKIARYTRTYNEVGSAVCESSPPTGVTSTFQMSLKKIVEEEDLINYDNKTIAITKAFFADKPENLSLCGAPTLKLAPNCTSKGLPTNLTQSDEKLLHFVGRQPYYNIPIYADFIVHHPKGESDCIFSKDSDGDKITLETTIPVADNF